MTPGKARGSADTTPPSREGGLPPALSRVAVALLLAAVLTLALGPSLLSAGSKPAMATAEVIIAGEVFRVDVADTPALQARGLGGRRSLAPNEGMLFVYAEKSRHSFWMRGMVIPIDIIWLDNRRVVHIEHRVPPPRPGTPDYRLPTYSPGTPANFVLEIAAGRARALGLEVGGEVRFRFNVP